MNTANFKTYHNLKRLWCSIWGHNMFAGGEYKNTKYISYDYCRFCEKIIGIPSWHSGKKDKSLNLKIKWLLFRIWLNKHANH